MHRCKRQNLRITSSYYTHTHTHTHTHANAHSHTHLIYSRIYMPVRITRLCSFSIFLSFHHENEKFLAYARESESDRARESENERVPRKSLSKASAKNTHTHTLWYYLSRSHSRVLSINARKKQRTQTRIRAPKLISAELKIAFQFSARFPRPISSLAPSLSIRSLLRVLPPPRSSGSAAAAAATATSCVMQVRSSVPSRCTYIYIHYSCVCESVCIKAACTSVDPMRLLAHSLSLALASLSRAPASSLSSPAAVRNRADKSDVGRRASMTPTTTATMGTLLPAANTHTHGYWCARV